MSAKTNFFPESAIQWLELFLKAILIMGGVLAAWQYFAVQQENRVKQTMEQLKSFNSDPMLAATLKLQQVWDAQQLNIQKINKHAVKNEEVKNTLLKSYIDKVIKTNQLQHDIELVVSFFDNLNICIENNICDKKVSRAFFIEYANSFYQLHKPWIEDRRRNIPGYACNLWAFVSKNNVSC